jgi:tight adherence protein C
MSAESFLVLWAVLAFLAPTLLALFVVASKGSLSSMLIALILAFYGAGAYLPWYLLRRRAERRTRSIDRSLPDAIDLIVTSVESGIALQGAMLNVSRKFGGQIGSEFARVVTETSVGKSRPEALEAMAERTGSRDVRLFVRAVNQAEAMGISIGQVLRSQSAELRERRRQAAREQANKVPVKMTIPTVLFIFPTMFLLVIGPVALRAADILRD